MCVADYLISNSDRHSRNWGFLYDTATTQILGLHPLFDHNNAFDTALINDPDAAYIVMSNVTMRQAARHAVQKINVRYNRPFKREDFMTQRQYDSFMNRLKELNIKQKDQRFIRTEIRLRNWKTKV